MGQVMRVAERFIERTKLAILHGECTAVGMACREAPLGMRNRL